jgi:hypothetical protein
VGFTGDVLTESTITTHCSGTTCTVVTVYDQCGSARDITQATGANQPEIYTSGAIHKIGSLPVTIHDGGAGGTGQGDSWTRGDSIGFSGNPALSIWAFASITAGTGTSHRSIVNIGASTGAYTLRNTLSTGFGVTSSAGSATGFYRIFTLLTPVSTASDYLATSAAASDFAAANLYQRGTLLSQSAVSAGTYNISTTAFSVGANEAASRGMSGAFNGTIIMGYVPNAGGATALHNFGTTLRTAAGI